MKIAITADCHLTSQAKNPERFNALENIFQQCSKNNVRLLIIAGDLFDNELPNYAEFENLYQKNLAPELSTVIIPGNHDEKLVEGTLSGERMRVYSQPTLQSLNDSRKILFLPYRSNQGMGENIAPFSEELKNQRWILVSHGDWTASRNTLNPYEKGLYMPLTNTDLDLYNPELVLLGHIHLAQQVNNISYPGSPCPLNISETGLRKFLILDTDKGTITPHIVDSPLLYFDEKFIMLPVENGLDLLRADIDQRITAWQLPDKWKERAQIRVEISGTSSIPRETVLKEISSAFKDFPYYQGSGPDLTNLVYSSDPDQIEISNLIKTWIDELDWTSSTDLPTKDQILEQALKVIHGG